MFINYALIIIGTIALVLVLYIQINGYCLEASMKQLLVELKNLSNKQSKKVNLSENFKELPATLQAYFKKVLPEKQPYIYFIELKQKAFLRMKEDSDEWHPLEAKQYFTTNPPGFIWDAKIKMASFVSVRALDMYKNGLGSFRGKLLSTFTVAEAKDAKELDTAELIRFLGESIWFPTALLPGKNLQWQAIDDHSAVAFLKDMGNKVKVVFHFNDVNEIYKVTTERYRSVGDSFQLTKWTGYFSNYKKMNGILIPTKARVEWNLPEGAFEYWKGEITEIKFYF